MTVIRPAGLDGRRVVLVIAVLVVAIAAIAASIVVARQRSTATDRFFDPPEVLPKGSPGTVIATQLVDEPAIRGTVHRVMYLSRSVRGTPVAVTGLVVVPPGEPPTRGWPVVSYGHGTAGLADGCAPSRDPRYLAPLLGPMLARGWVVAATDYEGLGSPGRHPYLVGESEGRSMVDAVRAARQLLGPAVSDRYVITGKSQGGHAALFARQIAARWAPELRLLGAAAVAPVSDVAGFVSRPTLQPGATTLSVVAGYAAAYPELRTDQVLTPEGRRQLGLVDGDCFGGVSNSLRDTPLRALRRADPATVRPWRAALDANTPGRAHSHVPVLVVEGLADDIVPPATVEALAGRMCDGGDPLRLLTVPGAGHDTVDERSLTMVIRWIADRFAGRAPAGLCPPGG